ncbi:MAG: YkgJ family cysteine cluster protein [Anaerocolumna aminovalerica]|uniref:YkgJ family cysteine cluster protein n=1 Tax=Anaerocolumna aminovalerica TaxID=1527 RepID=UPI00248B649F|nr:YkgJ family cysteine cluster protein [Anaerocolumna aminovalerica]MDU6266584.1 YkgJ family cysteine cluster protein [Anaerocolumna aminovalerica]
MKRNVSLNEISDGRLYDLNDLVEASCNGCKGAAVCCHGMGNSIILDPYDIYRLTTNLNLTFEQLLIDKIELNVVDGVILPNLKMAGLREGCSFLGQEGKCSIHPYRPGICRIFPLGRVYDNHDFKYFLQTNECENLSKTQIRVSKWIDTPEPERNKQFLIDWHYLLNGVENIIKNTQDENLIRNMNMYILNSFYVKKYTTDMEFYIQFSQRLSTIRKVL